MLWVHQAAGLNYVWHDMQLIAGMKYEMLTMQILLAGGPEN